MEENPPSPTPLDQVDNRKILGVMAGSPLWKYKEMKCRKLMRTLNSDFGLDDVDQLVTRAGGLKDGKYIEENVLMSSIIPTDPPLVIGKIKITHMGQGLYSVEFTPEP